MTSNGTPEPAEIDTSKAHAARVYDYLLGGRANFKVDREAAEITYAAFPGGIDGVRADVRERRAADAAEGHPAANAAEVIAG